MDPLRDRDPEPAPAAPRVPTLLPDDPGGPGAAGRVATLLPGDPRPGPIPPGRLAETLLPGDLAKPPTPGLVETLLPGDDGPEAPSTAAKAPRYTLARLHAEGGLGRVWIARDGDLNREVALKEIKSGLAGNSTASRRFLREAQVTGQLEHPNIVPVYELGRRAEDDQPFYTMRLLRGRSFREAIADHHRDRSGPAPDPLGLQRLLTSFVAICQAVGYAHSRGVIHRDLKPENVVVGSFGEVVVLDWGLAKVLGAPEDPLDGPGADTLPIPDLVLSPEASALSTVGAAGTPAYMAPEQARGGEVDERTDIYGLGAILFEVLAGRPPAEGRDLAEVLRRVVEGPTPMARQFVPGVPRPLEAVAAKALAREPGGRYRRASDLADDVQRWIAGEPTSAWREPWTVRARRWVRKHRLLVSSGSAAALVALLAGSASLAAARSRGLGLVDTLEDAQIERVPAVVEQVEGSRFWADGRLRADFRRLGDDAPGKLRAGLGLLPVEPGVAGFLYDRTLGADPATVRVVRDALAKAHREAIARRVEAEWDGLDPERRFRAACLLAGFDPGSARWESAGPWAIDHLMGLNRADPVSVGAWSALIAPALHRLVPAMTAVYVDQARAPADRALAARLLAAHAREVDQLCLLVQVADDEDFAPFLARLRERPGPATDRLAALVSGGDRGATPGLPPEEAARRRAQAALALTKLGRPGPAWPLLRHSPDPTARSWLVDRLGKLGDGPEPLLARLGAEPDVSSRRALALALGDCQVDRLPPDRREAAVASLLARFRDDPDPGLHSALDWLLRRWGRAEDVRRVESGLAGQPPGDKGWFVDPRGTTFAIVRGPVEFAMGSPEGEPDRQANEPLHRRTIGRSFAIATREVTVAEFLEFARARPDLLPEGQEYVREFSPEPDCPINGLSWLNAVLYCRWLGDREGLDESRQPYPPIDDLIKAATEKGAIDALPADCLQRPGYRLPTEAEWEYACRAGAATGRFFGEGLRLLPRYAWSPANSGNRTRPVGSLRPNDLGLFDVAGNLRECCQGPSQDYPGAGAAGPDAPFAGPIGNDAQQPVRGGSFLDPPAATRSALRLSYPTIGRQATSGLRVARTLP